MKLLEAALITKKMIGLDQRNCEIIKQLSSAVEDRLFWLDIREPEGLGSTYDDWEEKFTAMEEIHKSLTSVVTSLGASDTDEELIEMVNKVGNDILAYQIEYGGLSRLKL